MGWRPTLCCPIGRFVRSTNAGLCIQLLTIESPEFLQAAAIVFGISTIVPNTKLRYQQPRIGNRARRGRRSRAGQGRGMADISKAAGLPRPPYRLAPAIAAAAVREPARRCPKPTGDDSQR